VKVFFRDEIFITIQSFSLFYLFIWRSESFTLEITFLSQTIHFPLFTFLSEGDEVFITIQSFPLFTWGSESFTLEMKFFITSHSFFPFSPYYLGEVKVLSQTIHFTLLTFLSGEVKVLLWR
jgi:hypothetical protein